MVNSGKNRALPKHVAHTFSNFIKKKKVVSFDGDAHFNLVTFTPFVILGWLNNDPRKAIKRKIKDWFLFAILDFRNVPCSSFEGTMSMPFYEPFLTKFNEYASPMLREPDLWLWIVEDKMAEQVYDIVRKMLPEYAMSKTHYIPTRAEVVYTSLHDKKTKVVGVLSLYFSAR